MDEKNLLAVTNKTPTVRNVSFPLLGEKGAYMFNKSYWKSSAEKLKSTKYLAVMAMMIALKIVLSGFYFPIGENLHLSITFIFVAIEASILGPACGMVSGAITDLVSFMIHPDGPFFIGYVLTAMLGELVYGLFFYQKEVTLKNIIPAKLVNNYFVNVLIGSLWSSILYSKGYIYYMSKSLIKNTIMLPIEVMVLFICFKLVTPILKSRNLK